MPAFHGNINVLTVFLQPGAGKQDMGLSYNEVICIITWMIKNEELPW